MAKENKNNNFYNNFFSSVLLSAAIYKSPTKNYSCSFVELWLNHWCHMDYFNNTSTFLDLERVSCVALYGGQKALRFHQNISCVLKMNNKFEMTRGWVINSE